MYRLQVNVQINVGEAIAVIGSLPELGEWQVNRSILLQTDNQRYPQWWTEIAIDHSQIKNSKIEYKYLRIKANGAIQWERGSKNRWIPNQSEVGKIIIDDGWFDCIPSYPYGYLESPPLQEVSTSEGKKILVLGSSVALGCSAWLLRGWSWYLQQELKQRYGYQLINRSIIGANVNTIIARFNELVGKDKPWAIIIALSLGNEGFAYCAPQERKNLQQHFENGLKQLIKMITDMGAYPILGGVYPHGEYQLEHYLMLEETRKNMLSWGVPVNEPRLSP